MATSCYRSKSPWGWDGLSNSHVKLRGPGGPVNCSETVKIVLQTNLISNRNNNIIKNQVVIFYIHVSCRQRESCRNWVELKHHLVSIFTTFTLNIFSETFFSSRTIWSRRKGGVIPLSEMNSQNGRKSPQSTMKHQVKFARWVKMLLDTCPGPLNIKVTAWTQYMDTQLLASSWRQTLIYETTPAMKAGSEWHVTYNHTYHALLSCYSQYSQSQFHPVNAESELQHCGHMREQGHLVVLSSVSHKTLAKGWFYGPINIWTVQHPKAGWPTHWKRSERRWTQYSGGITQALD
jgi:hypothetical protein